MRSTRHLTFASALGCIVALFSTSLFAQSAENTGDWQTFGAAGEEFSVIMPKDPTVETGKMAYHKMELNTRLYLSAPATGPVYAVVSLSGIKSNPALYSEMERLNSYVDAFKKFFVPRLKGKAAVGKLSLSGPKKLNGHDGREYQLTIADLSGPVQVYSTRKRFYAVVFLSNKKDDALHERFISSFVLPERITMPAETAKTETAKPPTTTAQTSAPDPSANPNEPNKPKTGAQGAEGHTDAPTAAETKAADTKGTDTTAPGDKKAINGGNLNGKAISLPQPIYPADAKAHNVTGVVTVQVTIDEYGNVIAASAASGHPLLQQAAITAAYSARFTQTLLMGEPVKVTGSITYQFK